MLRACADLSELLRKAPWQLRVVPPKYFTGSGPMPVSARKFVSRLAAPVVRRAASSYIAGPQLNDALRVALRLQGMGFLATIGYWNGEEDSPRHVADAYLQSLAGMQGRKIDHLSIKLPALDYSYELLEEILCAAQKLEAQVHFDSLGPGTVDRTLSML